MNWQAYAQKCQEAGREPNRSTWRLVGPMHIAETREQARANVRYGLQKYLDYYQAINPARFSDLEGRDPVDVLIETRRAVIGTPDDAIAQIERLQAKQGEFGCYLQLAHNWANWDATKKSYELYARHVVPHFRKSNSHREESYAWAFDRRMEFSTLRDAATKKMFDQHEADRSAQKQAKGRAAE
jgi:limonene 1,2-monooxygenase